MRTVLHSLQAPCRSGNSPHGAHEWRSSSSRCSPHEKISIRTCGTVKRELVRPSNAFSLTTWIQRAIATPNAKGPRNPQRHMRRRKSNTKRAQRSCFLRLPLLKMRGQHFYPLPNAKSSICLKARLAHVWSFRRQHVLCSLARVDLSLISFSCIIASALILQLL